MIFFTAGYAPPLEEIWRPHLDGRTGRDAALAALVARTAER
jgi:hypothetical protein